MAKTIRRTNTVRSGYGLKNGTGRGIKEGGRGRNKVTPCRRGKK